MTILYVFRDALLLRTKPEDMVRLLHTNLLGTMLTCRAALRSMLHADGAAIVNIGTEQAESGVVTESPYRICRGYGDF